MPQIGDVMWLKPECQVEPGDCADSISSLLGRARPGPYLGVKDGERLHGVQGYQDPNQKLLVLGLQGQRKAIDNAEEGGRREEWGSDDQASVLPPRMPMLWLRPRESHLPKISSSSATPLKCSNS